MNMKALFQIEDIEFFSQRVKNSQRYRSNEIQDLGDAERIKIGIYDKTTKWGEEVKKRYKKLFHFEPDNRWQISGNFKKYSWGRLYLNQHGDQEIYYTIGVDSQSKALIIKIDFDRVKSKILTTYWLNYFDNLLKTNKIEWRVIEIDELRGKDEKWLIDETCRYISATIHVYKELHRVLFHKILVQSDPTMEITVSEQPLNQILYGPPGTGKTYSTIELAYRVIKGDTAFDDEDYDYYDEDEDDYDQDSYEVAKQWFKAELAKSEDRQLDFITFHQNYSYEDFVMGIKPNLNEGDGLSFNRHEGIFFKICQRALENLKQSSKEGSIVEPTFHEVFDDFIRPLVEENKPITIQMKSNNYSFKLININERNLGFEKQSGGTHHTLTLKTIQDLYEGNREYNIQGLGAYYYPLIDTLKALAKTKSKQVKAVPLKNYVIIIDEINRANISRVFGELITLIEEDKRWGNDHAMEVRLPDGHTKFTVPKNLYIIGTMNTADKSIALLDIALRRRFEFTALYPDSSKINSKYRTFFEALNEQIIAKKGVDFTIGHAYFMPKNDEELDFVKVMNKKVIPLLCEYFYNAKDNKAVVDLVEKAIAQAGFSNTVVSNAYQLLIQ